MNPERWESVKRLFHDALEQPPGERERFVSDAAAGNGELRDEVIALLQAQRRADELFAGVARSSVGQALSPGARIGPYEIQHLLGAGGMGEVYRARDLKLRRDVAIKVLPPSVAHDGERLRRFEREAHLLASLNHPNIAAIYGFEQTDPSTGSGQAVTALVLELVDGPTLAERIARGPVPVPDALAIARQVADALEAAHERGIIHRDLKPANVKLTADGIVKVLDFGLAKAFTLDGDVTRSPETNTLATQEGVIAGTAPYMSPEQARAQAVDKRADIWAFGCLLYELLTGMRAFVGDTMTDVLAAVVNSEPDWSALPADTPASLRRLLARCLEKDPKRRLRDIGDARVEIDDAVTARATAALPPEHAAVPVAHRSLMPVALGLAALSLALMATVWWLVGSSPAPPQPVFTQLTDDPGPELYPTLSPDGKAFAYAARPSGNWDIYSQRVGGKNAINLTRDSPGDDTEPAFSPDGERMAFRSERDGGGIFIMGATGESVRRITDFGYNPSWSPDGKEIVCATSRFDRPDVRSVTTSQLFAVDVTTGAKHLVTPTVEDAMQPHWSGKGSRIAYWSRAATGARDIWTIPAQGGEPIAVTNDQFSDWNPVWSPDARSLYFSSDRGGSVNIWRVPIDERTGHTLGPPIAITTPSPYSGYISVSGNGRRVAYVQQTRTVNITRIAFDPATEKTIGEPIPITRGIRDVMAPQVSPDGRSIVFFTLGKQEDLFVIGSDGTGLRQLTNDIHRDRGGRWTPDGKRIGFFSNRSGRFEIWSVNADGGGLEQLTDFGCNVGPMWSPDGKRFGCGLNPDQAPRLVDVGAPSTRKPPDTLAPWSERFRVRAWSPDGRTLAGTRFAPAGATGIALYSLESRQYDLVTQFGQNPAWLRDSRRLLFQHGGRIYLVDRWSRKSHEVLSVAPYDVDDFFSLSSDDHLIYFGFVVTEADVWMMDIQ